MNCRITKIGILNASAIVAIIFFIVNFLFIEGFTLFAVIGKKAPPAALLSSLYMVLVQGCTVFVAMLVMSWLFNRLAPLFGGIGVECSDNEKSCCGTKNS
jgi:hypothetical protein